MKTIAAIILAFSATAVYAACTTQTISVNGKTIYCMTCCTGSYCNTTCN